MADDVEFDARTVTIKPTTLNEYLVCTLCRGYLRDAQTIPECLHSFCKSCIYRHFLVQGSRNCPKCFLTLKPRPITTLISDQRLQDIVDKIFPEFKKQDAVHEEAFYKTHGFKLKQKTESWTLQPADKSRKALTLSNSSGAAAAATSTANSSSSSSVNGSSSHNHHHNLPVAGGINGHQSGKNSKVSPTNGRSSPLEEYEIEIHPLEPETNELPPLVRHFLRTEAQFKMFELRKFIAQQLRLEINAASSERELEITCMGSIVGPELSVQFIQKTFWQQQHQQNEPIVLHYRLVSAP